MNVKEMHIGINLLLQKVNSNYTDDFEPEELDWALNEEVLRFIKQRINPLSNEKRQGFQDTQKRIDDLKPLIKHASIPCYTRNSNSAYIFLPYDYLTLINDRTLTKNICGLPFSIATTNVNKYVACLSLKNDTNLYADLKIRINGTTVFDITDFEPFSSGISSLDAKFELLNLIYSVLTEQGYICRYNSYYDTNCKQGYVIVSDNAFTIEIEYDTTDIVTITSTTKTYTQINSITNATEQANRLTDSEFLYQLLKNSFGTTKFDSPLTTLEDDKLIVFHNQKFIPTTINISYLRKPRKISLSLNQDCDLDEWIHQEIVDNTAKRLAGLINSDTYKAIINENLLKE